MSYSELLTGFIEHRRDVTFPVHVDDSMNVVHEALPYGFNNDGTTFKKEWNITPQSGRQVRLVAAFTGTVSVKHEGFQYFILIYVFSLRPYSENDDLPDGYPLPKYAKYGPFSLNTAEYIVRNLLLPQNVFSTILRTYVQEQPTSPMAEPDRDFILTEILNNRFEPGIPLEAGTVLFNIDPGMEVKFSLHPEDSNRVVMDNIYFNPNFYFVKWRNAIEDYSRFPSHFKQTVLAPPITNGNIRYVLRTVGDIRYPISLQYPNLRNAYTSADPHDCILVIDNFNILDHAGLQIAKGVSIIGLTSNPSDDIKRLDHYGGVELISQARSQYPSLTNARGGRGLRILYSVLMDDAIGLVYLQSLAVCGNLLSCDSSTEGGAGIAIINNSFSSPNYTPRTNVHINNCAIIGNRMESFPTTNPSSVYQGGGILCFYSSPLITNCLIKENHSYCQGGGIGIHFFGWPYIFNNLIAYNVSEGNPNGDFDGGSNPGGDGDGGGIGIFQADKENSPDHDFTQRGSATVAVVSQNILGLWNTQRLQHAKNKDIKIINNIIRFNQAQMAGGGIYGTACAFINLYGNTITHNTAVNENGGGVQVTFGSRLIMKNDTVQENSALNGNGGGVFLRSSKARIEDVRITGNRSRFCGGIMILSKEEIMGSVRVGLIVEVPAYDMLLFLAFDHIDKVKAEFIRSSVRDNIHQGHPLGSNLIANRDCRLFQVPIRDLFTSRNFIRCLEIEISSDSDIPEVFLFHDHFTNVRPPSTHVGERDVIPFAIGQIINF